LFLSFKGCLDCEDDTRFEVSWERILRPYSLIDCYHIFPGPNCLCLQGTVIMETVCSSKTLVNIYQNTRLLNPDYLIITNDKLLTSVTSGYVLYQ
jgi:hypothetical protein